MVDKGQRNTKTSLLFRPGIAVLNLPQHLRTRIPSGAAHHP
ncbi:hypothetical protein [Dictyobacter aurantiacus]|nr:hypothetical protein [Dictyobacter aurantiacus]